MLINSTGEVQVPTLSLTDLNNLQSRSLEQYLEKSGLRVAQLTRQLLTNGEGNDDDMGNAEDAEFEDRPIAILTSVDQAGAVGLIAARHLEAWGAWVQVVTTQPVDSSESVSIAAEVQRALDALHELGVSTAWAEDGWELPPADFLIDAMQTQANRDLIQLVNSHRAPVLSIGSPAGLNPDSGEQGSHYITANVTLALGFPLAALASANSASVCGDIYLADIGLADDAYAKFGVDKSALFAGEELILLNNREGEPCAQ